MMGWVWSWPLGLGLVVLFTGFQAAGTRSATMVAGAKRVKIHGQTYRIAAEIAELASLSAHADVDELVDWLAPLKRQPPKYVFITYGEPAAATGLRDRLGKALGVNAVIPKVRQKQVLA